MKYAMQRLLAGLIIGAVLLILKGISSCLGADIPLSAPGLPAPEVGRFQLFTGPVLVASESGETKTIQAIYRIDTMTGQVWRLSRELVASTNATISTFAEGWVRLSEDFAVSYDTACFVAEKKGVLNHLSEEERAARFKRAYEPPGRRNPAPAAK